MARGLYRRSVSALLLCLLFATRAPAQDVRDATVQVTVMDPGSRVVPASTVMLLPLASGAEPIAPAATNSAGLATFERVPPGPYIIRAESPGFELATVRDVRIRAGTNRHVVMLRLARVEDAASF